MIKNKKGFTLIELIIVMAIVGILAVVAVVAISSKAGDARDARRRSDLSAIQTAFALHTSDGSGDIAVESTWVAAADTGLPIVSAGTDPGTYMAMANVEDPSETYRTTGTCVPTGTTSTTVPDAVCTASVAGDYTFLEVAEGSGPTVMIGTFDNYKIGATLEAGITHYIYVTQLGISS